MDDELLESTKAEISKALMIDAAKSYAARGFDPHAPVGDQTNFNYIDPNPAHYYPRTWTSDHVDFSVSSCGTSVGGHEVGDIAQYPDGTIVGNCKQCGDRMTLSSVPGGYTPMQIRGFLERVIAGDAESDGELLAELGRLIAVMELESEELELATNRIEIAKTLLTQRAEAKS